MAPPWPGRRLRTPPGQDSLSPPGRCARFSNEDGPPLAWQETPNTPWAGLPVPPRAGAPGSLKKMAPHWPGRRLRTPPGQDSPSPPGRCARFSEEDGPPLALARGSDHPLGWTPRPRQAGAPGYWKMMAPHGPCRRFRPPPGLGSPSPPGRCARLLADDASPWALQEAPTTPWPGLPVPPRPVRPVLRR